MRDALVLAGAYLLGSVPWAWLAARAAGVGDLRAQGSGNVGATNVLRTAGPAAGIAALVLDVAKGAAAVLLARALSPSPGAGAAAGLLAIAGHVFPVWLGWRGGKGVATAAGVFACLAPGALALAIAIFLIALVGWRVVSLASLLATVAFASAVSLGGYPRATIVASVAAAALIVVRHGGNIARLRAGREPRIGAGRTSPEP